MSGIEGVLLELILILENMLMVCGVFCVPVSRERKFLVTGGILLTALCLGSVIFGHFHLVILILRVLLNFVIVMLWTSGKIFRRFAIHICSTMYLHMFYLCIDLVFYILCKMPMTVLETYSVYRIVRGGLTVLIVGMLVRKLRKIPRYENILDGIQTKYFLIGSVCCFAASLLQHYIEDVSDLIYIKTDQIICVIICMVIVSAIFYALGVVVVILDMLRKKYQTESKLKDEYLQITREYVREVKANARETRKMRHDLQAHIVSLGHYMKQKEYQKAEKYLYVMQEHTDKMIRKMVSVNHEIVDAVLLEAQIRSETLKIIWKVEGNLPPNLPIGDFDLCTIFSNLLTNSVEACEKLPDGQRYIHLEIREISNNLIIEIMNPVKESVDLKKLGNFTTKTDTQYHGYGIANVRAAVEKNHGELFFEEREGVFVTRIIIRY
ncbi:ATP-binding protein [Lachnospiraceae bacterium]|nr:ATP-binding protein [Lachnospiraceae bacterium]